MIWYLSVRPESVKASAIAEVDIRNIFRDLLNVNLDFLLDNLVLFLILCLLQFLSQEQGHCLVFICFLVLSEDLIDGSIVGDVAIHGLVSSELEFLVLSQLSQ